MDQTPTEQSPFRILFVCTGNTCRSPMAEAIARKELADAGWDDVEVRSAGTGAFEGAPASGGALRVSARRGLDLSEHQASPLTEEALAWADLILTMSSNHLLWVVQLGAGERAALLTSFAAGEDPTDVPEFVQDPIGGPDEDYEETFELLERLIARTLRRLEPILSP